MDSKVKFQILSELDTITSKLDHHKRMMDPGFGQHVVTMHTDAYRHYCEFHRALIRIAEMAELPILAQKREYRF